MASKKNEDKIICSFCGEDYTDNPEVSVLESSSDPSLHICEKCLEKGFHLIQKSSEEILDIENEEPKENLTPIQIKEFLDQYVIGQEKAKQILSVATYNHMKLLEHYDNCQDDSVELQKANVLMVGQSGSGKTYLIQTLAKLFDVPYAICDSTALTASGYVGADVESVLQKLIINADGDIKRAERGIVFIDEIDKKASPNVESSSITRDVSGMDVQQALLKLIEGSVVDVPTSGRRLNPEGKNIQIDTSKILFIVGGAFPGIEKIIKKRLNYKNKNSIGGFLIDDIDSKENKKAEYNEIIDKIIHEDFKNYGLIPEFLGRLPIICPLKELTEDEMCRILTEPKNALIKQYQALMEYDNIELDFDKQAIRAIAKKALDNKTGARGLRSIMEDVLLDVMYTAPDKVKAANHKCTLKITEKCITDNVKPELVVKKNRGGNPLNDAKFVF